MPKNRDFKKLVRARMQRTGEAYTAARAHLVRRSSTPQSAPRGEASPPVTPDQMAALAGVSNAAIEKRTGCTWQKWVFALDRAGAAGWSHRAIAEHVSSAYKVPGWWAQTVTVGYERIKGLRVVGQRRSGEFEATKSKTIAAPAVTVSRAFSDSRVRRKWLPGVKVTVRKATAGRSVRIVWEDGTPVEVWLTSKEAGKTSVQVQHRKLVDKADAERRKAYWADRLGALQALLAA